MGNPRHIMVLTNCSVANCLGMKCSRRFPNPPKDMPLFKKWVACCGKSRLTNEGTPESILANGRVCDEHFVTTDFGRNNTLLRNAYPSLKMPGNNNKHEAFLHFTICAPIILNQSLKKSV